MENHQEDILKKFLQDTFSDYEPEPSDTSWENIFSAIQPNQTTFWEKSKPYIVSGLVILTGILLWYGSQKVEVSNAEIAFKNNGLKGAIAVDKKNHSDDSQTGKIQQESEDNQTEKIQQKSDDSQTGKTSKSANIQTVISNQSNPWSESSLSNLWQHSERKKVNKNVPVEPFATQILVSGQVRIPVKDEKKQSAITEYSKEIIVKNDTPKEEVENHPIVEKQSDEVMISTSTDTQENGQKNTLTTSMNPAMEGIVERNGQVSTLATGTKNSVDNMGTQLQTTMAENSIIEQVRYILPLENLKNKNFTLTKVALNSPVISPLISPNREVKPVRQHTYLSMSITPIQTYRILTVNNHSVQNVQTTDLFDSERNGWQFEIGLTKPMGKLWNFRADLSYLRMRQWSEYQVGTNELVLRNTNYGSNNSYPVQSASNTLEVVGQTIIESKNLHMVGLKMDVQKFFKITGKNRYFISTGTQLMYENTQKQSNLFLNVSAGFQHIVSPTTFLTIEPIASYSLNNLNDSKSLLQANGYNLGLKMGVSFKVK